jgi:phage/plasmid-associated DNA primase
MCIYPTNQYKESQDIIGQFITAKCVLNEHAETKCTTVYQAYKLWAEANREYVLKERQFSDAMKKRQGISMKRKKDCNWYIGIELLTPSNAYTDIPEDVL